MDNNTSNQYLAITANGADSSVSDLVANGYNVHFESYKADGMTAYPLLADDTVVTKGAISNKTGLISNPDSAAPPVSSVDAYPLELGTYKVCVVLTKGTSMVKSDFATVTVVDLDTLTTALNSVEGKLTGSNTLIKSTGDITLVNGEVLTIDKAEFVNDGKTYTATTFTTSNSAITTSNKAVASATLSDNTIKITASSTGTSTVTITLSKVTKAFNVTVVNVPRKAARIVAKDTPAKIVNGLKDNKYEYYVVDNHGGYVFGKEVVAEIASGSSNISFGTSTAVTSSAIGGVATFLIDANNVGTATVSFFFGDGSGNKTGSSLRLSSITVVDTDHKTEAFKEIAINAAGYVQKDTDTTLDVNPLKARSKALVLQFTEYANGVVSGAAAVTDTAILKYDSDLVNVYASANKPTKLDTNNVPDGSAKFVTSGAILSDAGATGSIYFTVVAKGAKTGTPNTPVALWNGASTDTLATATVTVANTTPYVEKCEALKMTSIDDTNVEITLDKILNIGSDNSVSGLKIANAPDGLKLYIDKDNGKLYYKNSGAADTTAQEYVVGYVKLAKNSGAFNDSKLSGDLNKLYTLTKSQTFGIIASDSGTINVYVDSRSTDNVDVAAGSVCIGTITVK